MKSLKRKDIEELRREMPVLEEIEQRMIVGGSGIGVLLWDSNANLTASTTAEKLDLLNQLMELLGFTEPVILAPFTSGGNPTQAADAGVPSSGGSIIFFNMFSTRWTTGNVYDIALTLVHEKNHIDTPWNNGWPGDWNEIEAYRAQCMHPLFQYASPAFKSVLWARASW
jgi:hypothetical protein